MKGTTTLYLSHSANKRDDPDWWIVEPRDDVERLRPQVEGLLKIGRRVLQMNVWPFSAQVRELTGLPDDWIAQALDEMLYRNFE